MKESPPTVEALSGACGSQLQPKLPPPPSLGAEPRSLLPSPSSQDPSAKLIEAAGCNWGRRDPTEAAGTAVSSSAAPALALITEKSYERKLRRKASKRSAARRHCASRWKPVVSNKALVEYKGRDNGMGRERDFGWFELKVNLGNDRKVILRRPPAGMYTKTQALHIIKTTTLKSSKERGIMIQFLVSNKLVPNRAALYRIIKKDEENRPIYEDDWGKGLASIHRKERLFPAPINFQPIECLPHTWQAHYQDNIECSPRPKKRVWVGDETIAKDKFSNYKVRNERGWKGTLRLQVYPVSFSDLEQLEGYASDFPSNMAPKDICSYIGNSDIMMGRKLDVEKWRQRDQRICRLYFDPGRFVHPSLVKDGKTILRARKWSAPPPGSRLDYSSRRILSRLRNYIRSASIRDGSPVICNGASANDHKMFRCNEWYTDSHGKRKRCPFRFQIRWDWRGYYVHLLGNARRSMNCGESWHCCKL